MIFMNDLELRDQLVNVLTGQNSHMSFSDASKDFPLKFMNVRPPNVDYTFWHLVEHIRITQEDVYDYMINPNYKEIEWPKDYWPGKTVKATRKEWDTSVSSVESTLKKVIKMVEYPAFDLFSKIGKTDHTMLREIGIIGNHNSYHIGELAILRQVVGAWPKKMNS